MTDARAALFELVPETILLAMLVEMACPSTQVSISQIPRPQERLGLQMQKRNYINNGSGDNHTDNNDDNADSG